LNLSRKYFNITDLGIVDENDKYFPWDLWGTYFNITDLGIVDESAGLAWLHIRILFARLSLLPAK
jgi:hypothetical protein